MTETRDIEPVEEELGLSTEDKLDRLEDIGRKTVKVAASTVLATTLVGALSEPPNTDLMSLPEPTPIVYTISMVGDCTLASYPKIRNWESSFENVVSGNWTYPFSHTAELFLNDDLTVVNLVCSISDQTAYSASTFSFLAPSAATEILTLGGVEAATMSNNHAMDFGQAVYDDTAANLDAAGISHCGDGEGMLCTTESGLVVGIYATWNGDWPVAATVAQGVTELKNKGAEVVIVSAHWGDEASYYANANQVAVAHAAIDAGADIIVGHGPHRLQRYEEYNGGVIFYSLANFIFGGNTQPQDMTPSWPRPSSPGNWTGPCISPASAPSPPAFPASPR